MCDACDPDDYTREDARDDHAISLWEIQNDLRETA